MASKEANDVISLVIIDDHVMVSQGLESVLISQPDFQVVGTASELESGLELTARAQPHVVIVDEKLPQTTLADSIPALRAAAPQAAIIVLGSNSPHHVVVRAIEFGAAGFLLKDQAVSELFEGIRQVHRGERHIAPQLVSSLVTSLGRREDGPRSLSRREVEVLTYLANGKSTAEVCNLTGLSVNTVRNHVQSALRRLGAHSKLEAVAIAQRAGIIEGGY